MQETVAEVCTSGPLANSIRIPLLHSGENTTIEFSSEKNKACRESVSNIECLVNK